MDLFPPAVSALPVLCALALCTGCTSLSSLHTARPLDVGQSEVVIAPGVYVFDDEFDGDSETLPFLEGGMRRGFGERVDAGVRTTSFAMWTADVNFAVVKNDRFALSIDPTISHFGLGSGTDLSITFLWLSILADVYTSEALTVTVGVKPGHASVDLDDDGDGDFGFRDSTDLLGYGIGARWRVSEQLVLLPELNFIVYDDDDFGDQRVWTFTLGFAF